MTPRMHTLPVRTEQAPMRARIHWRLDMRFSTLILAAALVGCAKGPELEPAAGVPTVNGHAVATSSGVRVEVDPGQWYGFSIDEPEIVRLNVNIMNNSGRSLELSHDTFALVGANGQVWRPIDPDRPDMVDLDLRDELLERTDVERVVEGPRDARDNEIEGILYFQAVTTDRVTFEMDLVDANTGQTFGNISIPFNVTNLDEDQRRRAVSLSR